MPPPAKAQFPGQVWNGLTPTRSRPDEYREADSSDFDQLRAEIIAIETFIFGGGGGGGGSSLFSVVNDNVGSIVIGTPVYSTTANHVNIGNATSLLTADVVGLVNDISISPSGTGNIITDGVMTATTGQWDVVTGGSGGLTTGSEYFLDPVTPGKLTATPPTTPGQYLLYVGRAMSTTSLTLEIFQPILL